MGRHVSTGRKFGALNVPQAEFQAFENPCLGFIEDYKGILEEHGVEVADVAELTACFDHLRKMWR